MSETIQPDFTPPTEGGLPQGAREFTARHAAMFSSINELFMPFHGRHPAIDVAYNQAMLRLKEVGHWVQDGVIAILNPDMLKEPAQEAADGDEE